MCMIRVCYCSCSLYCYSVYSNLVINLNLSMSNGMPNIDSIWMIELLFKKLYSWFYILTTSTFIERLRSLTMYIDADFLVWLLWDSMGPTLLYGILFNHNIAREAFFWHYHIKGLLICWSIWYCQLPGWSSTCDSTLSR